MKLHDGGDAVACGPRLVGNHNTVHELLGPGVLNLERLLVLESFGTEAPDDVYWVNSMEVAVGESKAHGTDNRRAKLVVDSGAAQCGRADRRGERPSNV